MIEFAHIRQFNLNGTSTNVTVPKESQLLKIELNQMGYPIVWFMCDGSEVNYETRTIHAVGPRDSFCPSKWTFIDVLTVVREPMFFFEEET